MDKCGSEVAKMKSVFQDFNRGTLLGDCVGKTITICSDGVIGDALVVSRSSDAVFNCLCLLTKVHINLDLKQLLREGNLFVKSDKTQQNQTNRKPKHTTNPNPNNTNPNPKDNTDQRSKPNTNPKDNTNQRSKPKTNSATKSKTKTSQVVNAKRGVSHLNIGE